jgi:hypothetical protein
VRKKKKIKWMISEKRNSFVDNPEYNFSRGMFAIPFEVEIKRRKGGMVVFFYCS